MLNTGNSLYWKAGINTKGVAAGANATKGILRGLMGSISRMDIFAAIGFAAALVFKKIIKGAYDMSLEFEHAMKEVQTISYATQKNFEGISEAILELSTQVPDAASKLVKAYYQIVSAGYDGAEALDVLSVSAKLATATITDTFNAADVLTYVMNAYGKAAGTATEIADKLFTVVKLGKVKMQELASSLSMVTGLAAEAGMSFNDLASFYAEAVKKIQPHIVSTGIRGFVTALLRASKEGAESAEAAKKMGIEFNVATLKTKGLAYMLNQMATATKGQKEKLMELFPNVRGLIGLLAAMTNEGINFIETSDKIVNSTGNMTDGFIIMVEDTTNQMAILKNNIAKKMKPIGDLLVVTVNKTVKSINKMFEDAGDSSGDLLSAIKGWTIALQIHQLELKKTSVEYKDLSVQAQLAIEETLNAQLKALMELEKHPNVWRVLGNVISAVWEDVKFDVNKFNELLVLIYKSFEQELPVPEGWEKAVGNISVYGGKLANLNKDISDSDKKIAELKEKLKDEIVPDIPPVPPVYEKVLVTYDEWLKKLQEVNNEMYELGKTELMKKVGLDLDTASYEQLQTILENIDDEEIEIAVKMRLKELEPHGPIEIEGITVKGIKQISLYDEDDFQSLFSKLETMKSLGLNVSEELTTAWDSYLKFIEKGYTRDSDNYRIAVEQKKQAEKEFAEWKKEQIVDQTEISKIMYDSMTDFFSNFAKDMILDQGNLLDALTNAWHQFANSVIRELIRIEAQKMALEVMGGFKGIFKFIGSLFGPGVIGAKGIKNFIVPPGYDNDTYPMFLQSGELVNVIPKNEVKNITNIENLIRDASPVSEKGVPAVTQNENNITNINNLIKDIPPVPHISNVSNSYSSFDSSGIQSELSQLRKLVASKETTILIDNKVMGKFSQRDLAFVVNEGLKVMKKTNL